jgi:S-adenosylmethionine decarboxylase proenzyme
VEFPFPDEKLGRHILIEFYECRHLPLDEASLQRHMERAAELMRATIVNSQFHAFQPHGLSGVVVIAESHLAIHTWPEFNCACVDLFTCSARMTPEPGIEYLHSVFGSGRMDRTEVARGANVIRKPAAHGKEGGCR